MADAASAAAASAAAILPRVHAALMRGNPRQIWRIADRHTRSLWCALAHTDSEVCPPLPWEELTDGQRVRLGAAPMVTLNFPRDLAELAAETNG